MPEQKEFLDKEGVRSFTSALKENVKNMISIKVPDAPDIDGTYVLKCVVSNNGDTKVYQWEAEVPL